MEWVRALQHHRWMVLGPTSTALVGPDAAVRHPLLSPRARSTQRTARSPPAIRSRSACACARECRSAPRPPHAPMPARPACARACYYYSMRWPRKPLPSVYFQELLTGAVRSSTANPGTKRRKCLASTSMPPTCAISYQYSQLNPLAASISSYMHMNWQLRGRLGVGGAVPHGTVQLVRAAVAAGAPRQLDHDAPRRCVSVRVASARPRCPNTRGPHGGWGVISLLWCHRGVK